MRMERTWDVSHYEKFVLGLQTPKQPSCAQMSVEDQHEWLEARRVTLLAHMELALAAADSVPAWLLEEWYQLQRARDALLRHRICRDNWPLYVRELGRVARRLASLLRWTVCDAWDIRHLGQLSADWLIVAQRLHTSRYHTEHALSVHSLLELGQTSASQRRPCVTPPGQQLGSHHTCSPARLSSQLTSQLSPGNVGLGSPVRRPGLGSHHSSPSRTGSPSPGGGTSGRGRARLLSPGAGYARKRCESPTLPGQGGMTRPAPLLPPWLASPDKYGGQAHHSWRRTSSHLTP